MQMIGSKRWERKRVEKGQENECCLCPRTCLISVCTTIVLYQGDTPTTRGQEKKLCPYGFFKYSHR